MHFTKAVWNNIEYDGINYSLDVITLTEIELETDKSDKGLYQSVDDYGTTYYYRGNVKNNNVYFAGFYWQIVRINGYGSIRLMYNGTMANAFGINQSINNNLYKFNSECIHPAYVGYMYGNKNSEDINEVHNNINESTAKMIVDSWYKTNIVDKGYNNYVSNNAGFCSDRTIYDGDGISTNKDSHFGTYGRYTNQLAEFICPNSDRDFFTVSDADIGNNALKYPVGLITYDELAYAGIDNKHINNLSYAYSSQNYWTMSPSNFNASNMYAYEIIQNNHGNLGGWNGIAGIRPVINLKYNIKITDGTGTSNAPYVIE